jgi:hypothetical protein
LLIAITLSANVVLEEASAGDPEAANLRLQAMKFLKLKLLKK